jgi:hypothetical protein
MSVFPQHIQPFSVGRLRLLDIRDVTRQARDQLDDATPAGFERILRSMGVSDGDDLRSCDRHADDRIALEPAWKEAKAADPTLTMETFLLTWEPPEPDEHQEDVRELQIRLAIARRGADPREWLGTLVLMNMRRIRPNQFGCAFAPFYTDEAVSDYNVHRMGRVLVRYLMTEPLVLEGGRAITIVRIRGIKGRPAYRLRTALQPVAALMVEIEDVADLETEVIDGEEVLTVIKRKSAAVRAADARGSS